MKEESIFLEFIGDSPTTRLLQFLIEGREFEYTLTDMTNAGVSWTTLHRIFPKFIENKIVIKTKTIGRIKLYKLNTEDVLVSKLVDLFDSLIMQELGRLAKEEEIKVKAI